MFTDEDLFKGIILYGLNNATYKMALTSTLLDAANRQTNILMWDDLAKHYFELYLKRIKSNPMPQQANPTRRTFIEKVVTEYQLQKNSYNNAIEKVAEEGFDDVVPRFQKIIKSLYSYLVWNNRKIFRFDYFCRLFKHLFSTCSLNKLIAFITVHSFC